MRKTRVRRHSSAPSGSPRSVRFRNVLLSLCAGLALLVAGNAEATFTDVTSAARIDAFAIHDQETVGIFAGGAGAGDYDRDGHIDLYVTRGSVGFPCLYRNRGDGTFSDQTFNAGLSSVSGLISSGTFADVDGDGWLDLLLLGLLETTPRLYLNRGDGTFALATGTGLALPGNSYSAAFGDYDRDGDLDLFVTRWGSTLSDPAATGRLWRNDGGGKFTDVSQAAGIPVFRSPLESSDVDYSFTGNFADIDDDGWPDLLVAADFGASKILRNQQDGTFDLVEQNGVPDDENGMGAAVGDFDGDGDLDWFVSSVWDPNGTSEGYWGVTGNRLYRNDGTGHFSDVSEAAGVRHGYWGWGSTFADVDLDGDPDLVEVNGYGHFPQSAEFHSDPARLFLSNGNGSFTESAAALGTAVTDDNRGVVAFDYDRDGDVDLFFTNNYGAPKLLRNDAGGSSLTVKFRGQGANSEAIGTRITASAGSSHQMREIRAGSNFESQDPAEAIFGLGSASRFDTLDVRWPGGATATVRNVGKGGIVLNEPAEGDPSCTGSAPGNSCAPGSSSTRSTNECLVEWRVEGVNLPLDRAGAPIAKASCHEGDPACDAGGPTDSCIFTVAMCTNNADPRLPACRPGDVSGFDVRSPKKASPIAFDRIVYRQIVDAFGPTGNLGVQPGLFRNATPNHCETMQFELRLGSDGLRPSKMKIDVKTVSSDGRSDTDKLLLTCLPRS